MELNDIKVSDHWYSKANLATDLTDIHRESFYVPGRLSSIVEVNPIEGPIFNSKEAAEQRGLELCKDWIDKAVTSTPLYSRVICSHQMLSGCVEP